ncbi:formyltransferase family protein [Paenibacillus flagellatus]|uniref:Formyl transferase n=1 Tax=Paenibacillus flagellatus TaxID=2211139 RepID=A0A2V5KXK6_9BACL|nr:formyltransferase family protein [Paenibacillus flagellatus]PYI57187.1 formyl transferase [Paenibacillus flagellatus]
MQEVAPLLGVPIFSLDDLPLIEADLGLAIRFHQILERKHLGRFRLGIVNLHGAPLPELRGSMCDAVALMEGASSFGVTLHWMDEGVDTGDILAECRFPVSKRETVYRLFNRCNETGLKLVKTYLRDIAEERRSGVPQRQIIEEKKLNVRTFTRKRVLQQKKVDPNEPERWWNIVRAFQFPGYEPAYIETSDGRIYLSINDNVPEYFEESEKR